MRHRTGRSTALQRMLLKTHGSPLKADGFIASGKIQTRSWNLNFFNIRFLHSSNTDGSLWLMHWGGVGKISNPLQQNARLTSWLPDKRLTSKFSTYHFNKMMRDHKGRIWASNWEGEIYVYDSIQNRFFLPTLKGNAL